MNALIDHEIVCPYCSLIQDNQVIPANNDIHCEGCNELFSAIILIIKG